MPETQKEPLVIPPSLFPDAFAFVTVEIDHPVINKDLVTTLGSMLFTDMNNKQFVCEFSQYVRTLRKEKGKLSVQFKAFFFEPKTTLEQSDVIPLEWAEMHDNYTLEEVSLSVKIPGSGVIPHRFVSFEIALFDVNERNYRVQYRAPKEELIDLNEQINPRYS